MPIQKDTEREIFDYIDLDGIVKMLQKEDEVENEEMNDEVLIDEEANLNEEEILEWYSELLWVDVNDVEDDSYDGETIDEEMPEYEPVFVSDIESEDDEWGFVYSYDE